MAEQLNAQVACEGPQLMQSMLPCIDMMSGTPITIMRTTSAITSAFRTPATVGAASPEPNFPASRRLGVSFTAGRPRFRPVDG